MTDRRIRKQLEHWITYHPTATRLQIDAAARRLALKQAEKDQAKAQEEAQRRAALREATDETGPA